MEERGWPIDASSLIYLAKADGFEELGRCAPTVLIPPAVWTEAVEEGERVGAWEVDRIREAEGAGVARRITLWRGDAARAARIREGNRLGRGEAEVLAVTVTGGRCVIDEGRASRVALSLGVLPVPTLALPVLGFRSGRLDRGEAVAFLRRLAVAMTAKAETVFAVEEQLGEEP